MSAKLSMVGSLLTEDDEPLMINGKRYRRDGGRRKFLATQDARARDTLLSAEPLEWNPQMMGKTWIGVFVNQLRDFSATDRRAACDALRSALDAYQQGLPTDEMGAGPSGSFATGGQAERPEKEFGLTSSLDTIQAANVRFWKDGTVDAPLPRNDATSHQIADINARNREFWAGRKPAVLGRAYGKG